MKEKFIISDLKKEGHSECKDDYSKNVELLPRLN